jgi:hypothetical protein
MDRIRAEAGLLLAGVVTTTQAAYAAGVLVLAMLVALLSSDLLERLTKLSVGPVAIEWLSDARVAATSLGAEEDEAADTDVLDLRLRLEAKHSRCSSSTSRTRPAGRRADVRRRWR